jgi:hypothetical protein
MEVIDLIPITFCLFIVAFGVSAVILNVFDRVRFRRLGFYTTRRRAARGKLCLRK